MIDPARLRRVDLDHGSFCVPLLVSRVPVRALLGLLTSVALIGFYVWRLA